jgi:hypothetical protein
MKNRFGRLIVAVCPLAGVVLLGARTVAAIDAMKADGGRDVHGAAPVFEESQNGRRSLVADAYENLPLTFERNQGQADPSADFVARGRGYTFTLNSSRTVLLLAPETSNRSAGLKSAARSLLSVQLLGANGAASGEGLDEQSGKTNYFLGNDRRKWRAGIKNYAKVYYRDVYPGIDLVYYGNRRELEHDFIVAPGADPTRIRMKFDGVDKLGVAANGDLELRLNTGAPVFLRRPDIYQERDGLRDHVAGRYSIKNKREVQVVLGDYDSTRPLIIDPVMSYATYLGGSNTSAANAIAVDADGNAYVTGETTSADFPTTAGTVQPTTSRSPVAFVAKLNSTGTALIYSTFLGGNQNGFSDRGLSIGVDSSGNAYVTGITDAPDFPTQNAAQASIGGNTDAFVAKLDSTGSTLLYST